jgi:hypothetical protein
MPLINLNLRTKAGRQTEARLLAQILNPRTWPLTPEEEEKVSELLECPPMGPEVPRPGARFTSALRQEWDLKRSDYEKVDVAYQKTLPALSQIQLWYKGGSLQQMILSHTEAFVLGGLTKVTDGQKNFWVRNPWTALEVLQSPWWTKPTFRLHSLAGPAWRWEGQEKWFIHGVEVERWVVEEPEKITVELIDGTSLHRMSMSLRANAEIRRTLIERYGWTRYLADSGAEIIDRRFNERDQLPETLYRMKNGQKRLVVVDPSTGRRYALGVPVGATTVEGAVNWMTHGLDRRALDRT